MNGSLSLSNSRRLHYGVERSSWHNVISSAVVRKNLGGEMMVAVNTLFGLPQEKRALIITSDELILAHSSHLS